MLMFSNTAFTIGGIPNPSSLNNKHSASLQNTVVTPRMQWIHQSRKEMAEALQLPVVDVTALDAIGRSRVPLMQMDPTPRTPMHLHPPQPVQELKNTER